MHAFLITTLAEYQTRFWLEVGRDLKRRGYGCEFISFDDRSTEMLTQHGFTVYSLETLDPAERAPSQHQMEALWKQYGITSLERWFLHERHAYNEQDYPTLQRKLYRSIRLSEHAIQQSRKNYDTFSIVQEVGGFLSVVGCYIAARNAKVTNWFIEPAFFKGHLFFTPGTFGSPSIPPDTGNGESRSALQAYLDGALGSQQIVIPEKDKHHYSAVIKKLMSQHNLRRLVEKSIDKYLLGKKQEFGYLGKQVGMHLRMLVNSLRLRGSYTPLATLKKFIYFPLHVPGDMALTLRSAEYVDQLSLLEQLIRSTPSEYQVAVKEHPAMIGALDASRLLTLRQRYPQFNIIAPSTNNYEVLKASSVVVSINSKSGAEAILLGKPAVVMGEAFYTHSGLATYVNSPRALESALLDCLSSKQSIDTNTVVDYFHRVWDSCFPGELYILDPERITTFTNSMIKATQRPVSI